MAEVKTYKCDICGKVYYSDEVETEVMLATKKGDEPAKSYEHVCPKCVENIGTVVTNPDELIELNGKYDMWRTEAYELKRHIRTIRNSVFGLSQFDTLFVTNDYNTATNDIIERCNELKNSREKWKSAATYFICSTISMVISLIIICCA